MPPIYLAAIVTTGLTAAFLLTMFLIMAGPHRRLARLMLWTLPFSFASNDWVKTPKKR